MTTKSYEKLIEESFTPGDWNTQADPDDFGRYLIYEAWEEQKKAVEAGDYKSVEQRDKANARLIAASKKLLLACLILTDKDKDRFTEARNIAKEAIKIAMPTTP